MSDRNERLKSARADPARRVVLAISKMETAEKVHTDEGDETEPAKVTLSNGKVADDLIEPRPLWVFDGASDKEIYSGDKTGLRAAAAELIRRRTQK